MSDVLPLKLTTNTNVDIKTECLLFGYMRSIGITSQIIPSTIIHLCIIFYHSKLAIICINSASGGVIPEFNICLFHQSKYYRTTVVPIDENVNPLDVINGYHTGGFTRNCFVNDFEIPQCALSLNKNLNNINNKYSAIFTIESRQCNAYIVDIHNSTKNKVYDDEYIDIYHWELPKIPVPNFYDRNKGSCLVYLPKHGLIEVGGSMKIKLLNFQTRPNGLLNQWKDVLKISKSRLRKYGSTSMIDDDKLIYCGGKHETGGTNNNNNNWSYRRVKTWKYVNYVDIYDVENRKWIIMSNMLSNKTSTGIFVEKKIHNRAYIGGGKSETGKVKTFEYLDLVKDKWISLTSTNEYHGSNPIIWMDVGSVIHISSTTSRTFEKMDLRTCKWETYIDKDHFKNVFGKKIQRKEGYTLFM